MAEPPHRVADDHAVALAAARLGSLLSPGQSLSASMPAQGRRMSLPAQPTPVSPPNTTCVATRTASQQWNYMT